MTSWSSIEEDSKRYHQNFLLCNNNEITACTAYLFNSFCEEVYVVASFKVVQQQTTGEVENSITCLCGQIISVCNSERIIKVGQYLRKLCSNETMSSFFWLTVYLHVLILCYIKIIFMPPHAMHSGGYYVFTTSRCLSTCPVVTIFHAKIDSSAGQASPLHTRGVA